MTGRAEPPEGTPDGAPGGGDDEYRSVVFDESFVEAARLQEYSAAERLQDEEHAAVHSRAPGRTGRRRRASGQGVALVVLIVMAFATAVYLGVRAPYPPPEPAPAQPMRVSMLPLAPQGPVPGGMPGDLFEHSPAKELRKSTQDGITVPPLHSTRHFSENEIQSAVNDVQQYLVHSALDSDVLTGGQYRGVKLWLDHGQHTQFQSSVEDPRSDGRHAATGWMVRFDPKQVELATHEIRFEGTIDYQEAGSDALDVTTDHVFVYALRPAGDSTSAHASLFTVRRQMNFHLERSDLRDHQLRVRNVELRAGPSACSPDQSEYLRPLLAGRKATGTGPAGTDPYDASHDHPSAVCGKLADSARPHPSGDG